MYEPTGVVFEFASIQSEDDAASFASRNGLLGHGPEASEWTEAWKDWQREVSVAHAVLTLATELREAMDGDDSARQELWDVWQPVIATAFHAAAETDRDLFEQASSWLV